MRSRTTILNFITISLVMVIYGRSVCGQSSPLELARTKQPNIVVLNLDDADSEILSDANIEAHYPNRS